VTAYLDESVRVPPPGLYVMAAVVVPPPQAADVRATLVAGLRRGAARYHWRDEDDAGRIGMMRRLHALGLCGVVTTAPAPDVRNLERARRQALLRLLWELDQRGVRDLVLESRGERRDGDDRRSVVQAQRARWAPAGVRYAFGQPRREPLLWLPDAVAGAAARAVADGDGTYLAALGDLVTVVAAG
jgi:hypothetical protein